MTHLINMEDAYTTDKGREVRILCINARNTDSPVVAMVDGYAMILTADGKRFRTAMSPYIILKPKKENK